MPDDSLNPVLSAAGPGPVVAAVPPARFVAYYRVSTERQGRSGLGLQAQAERCAAFAAQNGFDVVEAFTEVETGNTAAVLDGDIDSFIEAEIRWKQQ